MKHLQYRPRPAQVPRNGPPTPPTDQPQAPTTPVLPTVQSHPSKAFDEDDIQALLAQAVEIENLDPAHTHEAWQTWASIVRLSLILFPDKTNRLTSTHNIQPRNGKPSGGIPFDHAGKESKPKRSSGRMRGRKFLLEIQQQIVGSRKISRELLIAQLLRHRFTRVHITIWNCPNLERELLRSLNK